MLWNTKKTFQSNAGDRIFEILIDQTEHSDIVKSSKHAAAIVHKNRILSLGNNRRKTHPMMAKFQKRADRIFLHAEVDAVIKTISRYGNEILADCDLYVLRVTKTGKVAGSKPCAGCQRMISAFDIKNVYWS